MKNKKARRPQAAAPVDPLPDWATETPRLTYELSVYHDFGGEALQDIRLTEAEYVALKRNLAAMRGYQIAEEVDRGA